jgi:hypothetical protein
MREEFEPVYEKLRAWCRACGYAGHDPFDALNSRIFQSTPLRRSRLARLAWTQAFKRSPFNLRTLALVPAGKNPKGTALFALAELSRLRATARAEQAGEAREHAREARALLDDLLAARVPTRHGAAWGYNFDWQGRAFYAPRGTPAVVPTAFAVRALVEGAQALGASKYLDAAREACEFILRDLSRADETDDEVCFSYTPLDRTRVFNASLLAAEALASVGAATCEDELKALALASARYVARRQRADGSWAYGADSYQSWADNFHTAFVLTSLARILKTCAPASDKGGAATRREGVAEIIHAGRDELPNATGDRDEILRALARGYEFWRSSFFLADGWPKYYHHSAHPADAHSAGAAIVAFAELAEPVFAQDEPVGAFAGPEEFAADARAHAARVARWAVRNLYDRRGFFYYQKRRLYTVRTPYMRWSQAWMMYALARILEVAGSQ